MEKYSTHRPTDNSKHNLKDNVEYVCLCTLFESPIEDIELLQSC